jgi:hypothetical protein
MRLKTTGSLSNNFSAKLVNVTRVIFLIVRSVDFKPHRTNFLECSEHAKINTYIYFPY